ncbi:MAG: methionine--tRNA ligase [Deltaproteobacteria bacterium]|nr:methionine--tRNA ligase [Deltaproteobacteria bacterium]
MSKPARVLVTPALPYANGAIHLGHLVEHIQVNTYVRALRMAGDDVLYVCGADSHGAPIEIAAKKQQVAPEVYVEQVRAQQEATFARFHVAFDGGYGSTHTPENERHAGRFYAALKAAGHVVTKEVEQLQDPTDGRFLADRFVKGTCPRCGAADQYGDACENCNTTYRPTDLVKPYSVITGATPVLGKSTHYMLTLGAYGERLQSYLGDATVLHPSLRNFLDKWFADGLKDWDISRDGPYFGFKIPGEDNKYFYVWLDAPIGYVSLSERALATRGDASSSWESWWRDPSVRVEHFIGKDILYFHTLFWPAMLMATGDTLPRAIHVHGMLTVDGVKMSKSRGTFLNADDFAAVCEPQALRYYFAAKMSAEPQDIDLSFVDFTNRVNADLVNNVVNLVSRTVPMLHRSFDSKPVTMPDDLTGLVTEAQDLAPRVLAHYRALDTAAVIREVTALGSKANKLLQDTAPWDLLRTDAPRAHAVLTTALFVGKTCLALLKPVLPDVAAKLAGILGVAPFTFENAADPLVVGRAINPYERLFERLDLKALQGLIKPVDAPAPTTNAVTSAAPKADKSDAKKAEAKKKVEPLPPPAEITFDDFAKVDLRAAKIMQANAVEGSDKLIHVKADVGALGVREIFTGLRPHVQPEQLQGRIVVVCANLAPRKMAKFGTSHGMILAAGEPPCPLFVDAAKPGDRVS